MTTDQIKSAAIQHTKEMMGEKHFYANVDAALINIESFEAGVAWTQAQQWQDLQFLDEALNSGDGVYRP